MIRRALTAIAIALALTACLPDGGLLPTPTPQVGLPTDFPPPTEPPPGAEIGAVTYVVDGDTIDVSLSGQDFRVRYIGVNTPESDETCFEEAAQANRALVQDQIVTLVKDVSETDQFGRLLRYVYVGETFVNARLVQDGWAEAREYPPDTAHAAEFDAMEAVASAVGLGCWPSGVFER